MGVVGSALSEGIAGKVFFLLKGLSIRQQSCEVSIVRQLFRQLVSTSLVLIITLRFTCGERNICSTIKKSQNFMSMIVALISFFASIFQNVLCQQ